MKGRRIILAAAVAFGALGGAAPVVRAEVPSQEAIQSAKTKADHEALAAAYESEAKSLREQAKLHRAMRASYDKAPGYMKNKLGFDQHCKTIAADFDRAAAEAEALAKSHRAMAAKAK